MTVKSQLSIETHSLLRENESNLYPGLHEMHMLGAGGEDEASLNEIWQFSKVAGFEGFWMQDNGRGTQG